MFIHHRPSGPVAVLCARNRAPDSRLASASELYAGVHCSEFVTQLALVLRDASVVVYSTTSVVSSGEAKET